MSMTTDAKMKKLMATAYHEAGHFVANHHMVVPARVTRISIVPTDDYLGIVEHLSNRSFNPEYNYSPRTIVKIHGQIVMCLAGGIAEKRFAGRANHLGAQSDYNTAVKLALYVTRSKRSASAILKWLQVEAEDRLDSLWWLVEHFANTLLERKVLTGDEAAAVIKEWYRNMSHSQMNRSSLEAEDNPMVAEVSA